MIRHFANLSGVASGLLGQDAHDSLATDVRNAQVPLRRLREQHARESERIAPIYSEQELRNGRVGARPHLPSVGETSEKLCLHYVVVVQPLAAIARGEKLVELGD
jgi:hypothetical protein